MSTTEAGTSSEEGLSVKPLTLRTVLRDWAPFVLISAFFFHVTAGTFASLGVALPYMIDEMGWAWSEAGAGFSLLALMVGLAALLPAWIMRIWGTAASYLVGGVCLIIGFSLLATTTDLIQYFIGAALVGLGFPLSGIVPGTHYLNNKFSVKQRGTMVGAYLMIGGLGGVAGPLLVAGFIETTDNWRVHWWAAVAVTVALMVLILPYFRALDRVEVEKTDDEDGTSAPTDITDATGKWTYGQVLRTGQYYVIVASITIILFCGTTVASWAVTHLNNLGLATSVAAGALSAQALINALSRGFGGAMTRFVSAKWLLVSGVAAAIVGNVALAFADNAIMLALFAIGEGYGFGMVFFATTVLIVDYYGRDIYPELLGTKNFITTLAMLGPVSAGFIAERFDGFGIVFIGYASLLVLVLIAAIMMRQPTPPDQESAEPTGSLPPNAA